MAHFKIQRGISANLPTNKVDGSVYFCTDTGDFYIDYIDANNVVQRKQIRADEAKRAITADSAASATTAGSATKATKDASGNTITATYETKADAAAKLDESKEYADELLGGIEEGIVAVLLGMYGSDITEDADPPTIRDIANDEAQDALVSANNYTDTAISTHDHHDDYYTEAEINAKIDEINASIEQITDGTVVVEEANYAASAESATTATTASKLGSSPVGSTNQPIYLNNGVATEVAAVGVAYGGTGATTAASARTNLGVYSTTEIDEKLSDKANSSDIPDSLADLASDATHRTVTDTEKNTWNAKSNFSGNYNDLTNKPTIPSINGLATEDYVDDIADTKVDKVTGKGLSTNDYTNAEKTKLSGIASNAEVNQNAFSNVVVGSTTIAADSKTDSLKIASGTGISVSGDDTNDTVTITNSGVRSISTGTANGTISVNTNGTSADVAVKGLGSAAYTASTAYDAAGTAKTKADAAYASAKSYTDGQIALLMNNSTEAVDSIMELAAAMEANEDVVDALEQAVGNKAAKNHTHTVSHTPAGSISDTSITPAGTVTSAFTGTAASHNHTFTGTEASHKHTFTGTQATISTKYTPAGSVSSSFSGTAVTSETSADTSTVASSTHTHKYTPSGSVSQPTFSGTAVTSGAPSGTETVYSITAVGTLPSLNMSVSNRCLNVTFGTGTLPTKGTGVTVAKGTHTHSVTAAGTVSKPTFTGTEGTTTSISGTTVVSNKDHTHSVTAAGAVTSGFTGTEATISTKYTPAGTIADTSLTPAGTISSKSLTPAGTIDSAFTGTAASHKHTFTGIAATLTTSTEK